MLFKKITRSDPETMFVVVYNGETTTMSTGGGVWWNMDPSVSGTLQGLQVRLASNTTTSNPLQHFAGVVAGHDIEGGMYGTIQVWGIHTQVSVFNPQTTAGPTLNGLQTAFDATSVSTALLIPANRFHNTTSVSNSGYFAMVSVPSNYTSANNLNYNFPRLLPIEQQATVATGTTAATNSCRMKAFIRAL